MRALFENKRLIVVFAALALGALTLLAIGLNDVPFRDAERFGRREAQPVAELPVKQVPNVMLDIPIWKQIVVWVLASLLLVLVGFLLSPRWRKRLLLLMLRVGFTVWAIYFLFTRYGKELFGFTQLAEGAEPPGEIPEAPVPVFTPPQVSPAFAYLISFGFAIIWLVILWTLYRGWLRYMAQTNPRKPLDEIARIARTSLDDLSSGRNSTDVIINCYLQMSDVVSVKRQLRRSDAMTPHEFSLRLEQAGLPSEAVIRLTRLFETVRYGDRKSSPKENREAVNCLETILNHCGEPV